MSPIDAMDAHKRTLTSIAFSRPAVLQVATEMRAKNNVELQRTNRSRMLNCFDPNINIAR
jgi:hypothetical protein